MHEPRESGPLAGVRIVDLTSNFMGPYASLLLADLGADVCKVEAPEGDTTRDVGPSRHAGMAALFLHLNRNKRSMVLNLKKTEGAATLRRMLARADVLLYSLRPKAMARLGLAWEDVRQINPRVVYCGAFGFGQDGPYADRPAYDDLIQAAVGMPVLQARKSGSETYVATAIADRVVGMATSNAVAAALYRREKTGQGQSVSVPMFETFAHLVMSDHLYGHTFVPPIGDWGYARMTNPGRKPFRTLDGHLGVHIVTDRHWQRFFDAIGRGELMQDARYSDMQARNRNLGELYAFLAEVFATNTNAYWMNLLTAADIPAMELNTPAALIEDPHMKAVGFFEVQEHPSEGLIRCLGVPSSWSGTPPQARYPAPRLGQHTEELLREYGLSPEEVRMLLASGAALASPA